MANEPESSPLKGAERPKITKTGPFLVMFTSVLRP